MKYCKSKGYEITLIFIWLDSPETAKMRVHSGVEKDGHNIPEKTIERRYFKGIENFRKYFVNLCDSWMIWDNTGNIPKPVAQCAEKEEIVFDKTIYKLIFNEK